MEYKFKALKKEKNLFLTTGVKKSDNITDKKQSTPMTKNIKKNQRKSLRLLPKHSDDYLKSIKNINESIKDYNNSFSIIKVTQKELKEAQEKSDYARNMLAKMHDTYPQEIKDKIGVVDYSDIDDVIRVCNMILNDKDLKRLLQENNKEVA